MIPKGTRRIPGCLEFLVKRRVGEQKVEIKRHAASANRQASVPPDRPCAVGRRIDTRDRVLLHRCIPVGLSASPARSLGLSVCICVHLWLESSPRRVRVSESSRRITVGADSSLHRVGSTTSINRFLWGTPHDRVSDAAAVQTYQGATNDRAENRENATNEPNFDEMVRIIQAQVPAPVTANSGVDPRLDRGRRKDEG